MLRPHFDSFGSLRRLVYSTPQTPKTSLPAPSCSLFLRAWSAFTLRTDSPTARGPRIVHRTMAQVTTRNMSVGSPEVSPKTPWDSATPEIRKPISPRAHIAKARISGGCSEKGFGGLGEDRASLSVLLGEVVGRVRDGVALACVEVTPSCAGGAPPLFPHR